MKTYRLLLENEDGLEDTPENLRKYDLKIS